MGENNIPYTDWVVVAEPIGIEQAEIMAGSLRAESIPVWIRRESAGIAIALTVGMLGHIEIMVPFEYKEQALALLEGGDDEEYDEPGDDDAM